MMIQLRVMHDGRSLEISRDLASLVVGRAAVPLVTRLRWVLVAIAAVGAPTPVIVTFALHWASGGLGQFALAYPWPLWLEAWWCVGWWLAIGVALLWCASLQRELAWLALKQPSTLWIIAMTGLWTAGFVGLYDVGKRRSTWVTVPVHILLVLAFPLIAMADALPPAVRLSVLRLVGPTALAAVGAVALVLRLPTAEATPGKLVWTVMGTDTMTNLQVITFSGTLIGAMLAEGVLKAWCFPNELAFIRASLTCRVTPGCGAVTHAVDEEPHLHATVAPTQEAAQLRVPSVARRSGSKVHPGQTNWAFVHERSDTVESSGFTSAVPALTAISVAH